MGATKRVFDFAYKMQGIDKDKQKAVTWLVLMVALFAFLQWLCWPILAEVTGIILAGMLALATIVGLMWLFAKTVEAIQELMDK